MEEKIGLAHVLAGDPEFLISFPDESVACLQGIFYARNIQDIQSYFFDRFQK